MLNDGQDLPTLRQLARATNERLSENMYIETTMFYGIYGMRPEYDHLLRERGDLQPASGS